MISKFFFQKKLYEVWLQYTSDKVIVARSDFQNLIYNKDFAGNFEKRIRLEDNSSFQMKPITAIDRAPKCPLENCKGKQVEEYVGTKYSGRGYPMTITKTVCNTCGCTVDDSFINSIKTNFPTYRSRFLK